MTEQPLRILVCEDDEKLATLVIETLDADGGFIVVRARRTATRRFASPGSMRPTSC